MEKEFELKENSFLKIPLPPRVTGISKFKRHIVQFIKIFFGKEYASYDAMFELGKRNYNSEVGMSFWKEISRNGLETFEEEAIKTCLPLGKNVLVYGCGAGREAFGINELGYDVDGYDYSENLINYAKSLDHSDVNFLTSLDKDKKYDLIFVSNIILNLIPGELKRTEFLSELKAHCHNDSSLIFFINQEEYPLTSRFFWISFILRIKSLLGLGPWEKGDIVSGWMANRTDDPTPLYFFNYSNDSQIRDFFEKNGFACTKEWGIFWKVKLNSKK